MLVSLENSLLVSTKTVNFPCHYFGLNLFSSNVSFLILSPCIFSLPLKFDDFTKDPRKSLCFQNVLMDHMLNRFSLLLSKVYFPVSPCARVGKFFMDY